MNGFWLGYWFKNWYLLYKIGYAVVSSGLRTYFKKHQYIGKEKIPKNAGILYAVNHQNAFLDPILIACRTKDPTHFLTRADIFKKKSIANILSQVYMLPIYRQRDGVDTIEKNADTFNKCYDILHNKGNIIIFPEGNHNYKKSLRPFKKGIARIALGAAKKYNLDFPLYIIPLGLDYENHFNMNGDLLLNAGIPINISNYYSQYEKKPAETVKRLSNKVYEELEKVMINIKDNDHYDSIYYMLHRIPINGPPKNTYDRFLERQKRLKKIEEIQKENKNLYIEINNKTSKLIQFMSTNKLRPYLLERLPINNIILLFLCLVWFIFLPLHLIGLLTNYLPYKAPVWFVHAKVKDRHFHSSLKMAMGVMFFLIYWLFLILIGYLFLDLNIKLLLLTMSILPLIAFVNFKYWILTIKLKGELRYSRLKSDKYLKEAIGNYSFIKESIS